MIKLNDAILPTLHRAAGQRAIFRRRAVQVLVASLLLATVAAETNSPPKPVDLTELSLEALMQIDVPTVYGASKIEQKTTEAPSSITIITAEEIKRYGYRTLADVLQSVQGFNISYDRNYAFLGARGISLGDFNSRILLLVNGHRVNNNLTDGALLDTSFILDLDLVDRVEIIRGPSAVLYGNNAFFGIINVITRQGHQLNGAEASFDYGAFDTYKGRVTVGKQFTNGINLLLSGTYYESAGQSRLFFPEFNTPTQNYGGATNLDADLFGSFFGSASYRDLTLEGALNHREKANPTAQFGTTFNDPRSSTTDEQSYAAMKYAHHFEQDFDVSARLYYDSYAHEIGYPFAPHLFYLEQDTGEWWGTELQLNKRLWGRHELTLGAEYRDDFHQEQIVSGQAPITRSRESYGVYFQSDFALRTNLHFNGGVRYDQYGDFQGAFNPRLALIYNPIETATIKAIYGTAFRAPNFSELSDARFQDIKPEEITSYELVYEQAIGKHLRSSISGFYNQMNDLIVFDSGNYTNFNANTSGLELALEETWANGLQGRASYSFQDTKSSALNWNLPDSPNHLFKFNLSAPLYRDKLFAGLEFRLASSRQSLHNTTDSSGQPIIVQGPEAASYGIVNLTIFSQNLVKNLDVSASVYNLFDHRYSDPASRFHTQDLIQQDGRSFRLKLSYRF